MAEMIDISLTADTAALSQIEAAVEVFAEEQELPPKATYALSLIIEELVTNVVKYGYAGREPGPLMMTVRKDGDGVVGELTDAGVPFDPTQMTSPDVDAGMEERHVGGLGVHLVRTLAEEFTYRREDGLNIVRFRLAAN